MDVITKRKILEFHNNGKSTYEISAEFGIPRTTVQYWTKLIKEGTFSEDKRKRKSKYEDYDWSEIQKKYDGGYSIRDLISTYKHISYTCIMWASKNGKFKTRTLSESIKVAHKKYPKLHILSKKTKDKISKSMTKYLEDNPDMVPYRRFHNGRMSWPEKVFFNALVKNNISGWKYNYRNGIYTYDFGFEDINLDIEVDGPTHRQKHVILKDQKRDNWSESNGWTVIRFTSDEVIQKTDKCIETLKKILFQKV